jgi:hypothetical protein
MVDTQHQHTENGPSGEAQLPVHSAREAAVEMSVERPETTRSDELAAVQTIVQSLLPFDIDSRERLIQTVLTFLDLGPLSRGADAHGGDTYINASPSNVVKEIPSPKEFMLEKQPGTDIERVAALAFYLTHFRETPHFKTLDISKLNTEAAQPKFANAAYSVDNASRRGFLVPAGRGMKQLSGMGEQFVLALPDRDRAREVSGGIRQRKSTKRAKKKKLAKGGR